MPSPTARTLFGFNLLDHGVEPIGAPSLDNWRKLGHFLLWMDRKSPWLITSWLLYGEGAYGERFSQAIEITGWSQKTIETYLWVGRHVPPENQDRLPFGHYLALARMQPPEQDRWITWCEDQDKETGKLPSKPAMTKEIRRVERKTVAAGKADISGQFHVVYADPPWLYRDSGVVDESSTGFARAEHHYPSMTIDDIAALPVRAHMLADSVLFLWVPEPIRQEINPVLDAWGCRHATAFVWVKERGHYGHYVMGQHEHLLICPRGRGTPDRLKPMITSVVDAMYVRDAVGKVIHSAKPPIFRQHIERLYDGPYLELLGREPHAGWTVVGNQLTPIEIDDAIAVSGTL